MKVKLFYIIPLFLIVLACSKQEKLVVKDLASKEYNLLKTNKEKILIITNFMSCHDCIINLNEFISENYKLSKYDYFLIYEDPKNIPERRIIKELYLRDYTPNINKVFFISEDLNIQRRLNITQKIFQQYKPYVVFIDSNKKATYYCYENIFNADGTVNKSFKIK